MLLHKDCAGDDDTAVAGGHSTAHTTAASVASAEHTITTAGSTAGVSSACGIETVITGDDLKLSTLNINVESFQALITFSNIESTCCNCETFFCVNGIIAGCDLKRAPFIVTDTSE